MEGQGQGGEMGLPRDHLDSGFPGQNGDDGNERRSGSDNMEGGSDGDNLVANEEQMEDQGGDMGLPGDNSDQPGFPGQNGEDGNVSNNIEGDTGDDQVLNEERPPKKKCHRHTPQQIQELEHFFREYPHPNDRQRAELSRKLGMEARQIKFWFQNRRTQLKTQVERHENAVLRQEHDHLRAEMQALMEAMYHPLCNDCGGVASPNAVLDYEANHLRTENNRLREEVKRITEMTTKFLGKPYASSSSYVPPPFQYSNSGLNLSVGRNEYAEGPSVALDLLGTETSYSRSMFVELSATAMEELLKLAQVDCPLWNRNMEGKEVLIEKEYRRIFPSCLGRKPSGYVTEASRETAMANINSVALVETLMDANRWVKMFPCIVAGASTVDVISNGMNGTKNCALQLMSAEFQVLSPLVPVRQVRFLRFCKQQDEGVWAVVDVSIDINAQGTNGELFLGCRRLPSGCVVQDMPDNHSKVTWIEHSEYDERMIHHLCRMLVSTGWGLGAQRWVATLQRHSESLATLISPDDFQHPSGIGTEGRKSLMKLTERMINSFCSGVCASSAFKWEKLYVGNVSENMRVLTRKNLSQSGEPAGIVLCAATSVWIPATRQRVFDFLRDEEMRTQWDILWTDGPMQGIVHISKTQDPGNRVSIFRSFAVTRSDQTTLILQETVNDASGSLLVYAPIDLPSINVAMNGGDSSSITLLPSGFAILPDGLNENNSCILTVGFQILLNSFPSGRITVESVHSISNLVTTTIETIAHAIVEP